MRRKLKGYSEVLALLTTLLLFLAFFKSKMMSGAFKLFSPFATKLHLAEFFSNGADFFSYLREGILMRFIDYRSNNILYFGIVILAIVLLFVLDAYFWDDDKKGNGDSIFIITTIIGTALFGLEFILAVIIFLFLSGLRER